MYVQTIISNLINFTNVSILNLVIESVISKTIWSLFFEKLFLLDYIYI